jgi:hypothetical protein
MNKYIAAIVTLILVLNLLIYTNIQNKIETSERNNISLNTLHHGYSDSHLSPTESDCEGFDKPIMLCTENILNDQLTTETDSLARGRIYGKLAGIYHTRGDEVKAVFFYSRAAELDSVNAKMWNRFLEESLSKLCQSTDSDCQSI